MSLPGFFFFLKGVVFPAFVFSCPVLLGLPLVANAVTATSAFSGEVPQSCLIQGFEGERELLYDSSRNRLYGEFGFTVTANSQEIQLGLAPVQVNSQVGDGGNAAYVTAGIVDMDVRRYLGPYHTITSSQTYAVPMIIGAEKSFEYRFGVGSLERIGDKYRLLPGNYSFTVVLSCYMN